MDYELCYKVIPMPCNTNYNGDIFGGWLLSQMDLAGVSLCNSICYGRYVTMTIDRMVFRKPVKIGDIVEILGRVNKIGNTSLEVDLKVQTTSMETGKTKQVTEGTIKYVKIDEGGNPIVINPIDHTELHQN
jgi:acyl-CoA thioesterase YciA